MKKVYISANQYGLIKESEWNFHFGNEHDMRPYLSDNKFRMAGRETGHFGSGTYFSTYRDNNSLNQYRDGGNPNFIKVGENVYRVDFDLYKNLYRVRSKKQGDVLYTMLRNLNRMSNRISHLGRFNRSNAFYDNADLYQKIKSNADGLGLKCPSYYELTRMAQRLGQDEDDIRSLSTIFMELNGYNGVNVSGIEYYDNTKHGSVIYDLSKVDGEVEEVSPKNLFVGFRNDYYGNAVVRDGYSDNIIDSLNGESFPWYNELNGMPLSGAMRLLKNYTDSGNILDVYIIKGLKPDLIKRYLRILFVKRPDNRFYNPIEDKMINGSESSYYTRLIDEYGAYYWVNYESRYDKRSILVNLLNEFSRNLDWDLSIEEENAKKKDYLDMLMGYMERDLTKYEKEYIEEDYYDME